MVTQYKRKQTQVKCAKKEKELQTKRNGLCPVKFGTSRTLLMHGVMEPSLWGHLDLTSSSPVDIQVLLENSSERK